MRMTKNHHYRFVDGNTYILRYRRVKASDNSYYEFMLLKTNDAGMEIQHIAYMKKEYKNDLHELSEKELILEML